MENGFSNHLKELMAEWAEHHRQNGFTCFISDGAVNDRVYESSHPKIVFFLKEAYSKNNNSWSLTQWLDEGAMTRMWGTVAEWIYGIRNTTPTLIPPRPQLTNDQKTALLRTIAIINAKKSNGKTASDYNDLLHSVQNDWTYLKRELELLSPDIIVCGNTSGLLRVLYGATVSNQTVNADGLIPAERMNQNGYALVGNQIIIDYYHPANRYPSMLNYYALCSLYQQALKERTVL